jgi:hypothetical protein
VARKAFGGLCRRKSFGGRRERGQQLGRITAPIRVLNNDRSNGSSRHVSRQDR